MFKIEEKKAIAFNSKGLSTDKNSWQIESQLNLNKI